MFDKNDSFRIQELTRLDRLQLVLWSVPHLVLPNMNLDIRIFNYAPQHFQNTKPWMFANSKIYLNKQCINFFLKASYSSADAGGGMSWDQITHPQPAERQTVW